MTLEEIRNYCLEKKGVNEGLPFDNETLVFKVMDKMFCLSNIDPPLSINLKCDPEMAVNLREKYDAVKPGYHMNKKHWNTIEIDDSISDKNIYKFIDDSYNLVVEGLTKKQKENLKMI